MKHPGEELLLNLHFSKKVSRLAELNNIGRFLQLCQRTTKKFVIITIESN